MSEIKDLKTQYETISGNEATARSAYLLTEAAPIYPITPSSDMAECCDQWANKGHTNILGKVPEVIQMQSEAGAIAAASCWAPPRPQQLHIVSRPSCSRPPRPKFSKDCYL